MTLSFVAGAIIIAGWELSGSVSGDMSEATDCLKGSTNC
jgi:hypothetical protein